MKPKPRRDDQQTAPVGESQPRSIEVQQIAPVTKDQPPSTAAESPTDDRRRLLAAWDIAGQVNLLNWVLQQALLQPDTLDVRMCWAERRVPVLAVGARELVETVRKKDSLAQAIRAVWSNSEFGSSSPPRYERLVQETQALHQEAESQLQAVRSKCDEFDRIHEDYGKRVTAPCRSLIERITDLLEENMSEAAGPCRPPGRCLHPYEALAQS